VTCRYYIDSPSVVVRGKPSASLVKKLEADEKERIAEQVKTLGPEGLAKVKEELDAAKAEHEKPIPEEILQKFPVPDVHSIAWIPVQSTQASGSSVESQSTSRSPDNTQLRKVIDSDGSPLPFFVQYDHVQVSYFIHSARTSFER